MIGRELGELTGVILTGSLWFFVDVATVLASAISALFMAACCLTSGVLAFTALFCGAGRLIFHKWHELVNAAGHLTKINIPFALVAVATCSCDKLTWALTAWRVQECALRRNSDVRLDS